MIVGALLLATSVTDLRSRRIPNRFLFIATILHLLLDLLDPAPTQIDYLSTLLTITIFLSGLSLAWVRRYLLSLIGMGDLKLILYLSAFFFPWIDLRDLLLGLALVSSFLLIGLWIRRFVAGSLVPLTLKSHLPFAPIVASASGLTIFL